METKALTLDKYLFEDAQKYASRKGTDLTKLVESYLKRLLKKEKKVFAKTFLGIFLMSQIINISMNLGLIPIIGIPLPFVSYGGSSTITLFLFIGIIFSNKKVLKL